MKAICALFLLLSLSSCVANKVISERACEDPKYLHLLTVPIDSMSSRDFEYFKMKDRECEEATAAANAVEQQQIGQRENTILVGGLGLVSGLLVVLLSTRTIR